MNQNRFFLTPIRILLLAAVLLAGCFNLPFFEKLTETYSGSEDVGFVISAGVALTALNTLVMGLLSLIFPVRMVVILLLLVAVPTAYFTTQVGTVFTDDFYLTIFATDQAEAVDIITPGLLGLFVVGVLLPAVLLWRLPYRSFASIREKLVTLGKLNGASLLVMALCFTCFSASYMSFIEEHKPIRYRITPLFPMFSFGEYVKKNYFAKSEQPFLILTEEASIAPDDHARELIIVVVGETARADHFSVNGYSRPTNPRLEQEDRLISFSHVSSCGTSTAISVPCMFSFMPKKDFDVYEASRRENVLDILRKANVNILWRDNNSNSKHVADRVPYQNYKTAEFNPICDEEECRDTGMLYGLQDYVNRTPGDKLIVLHQMGSHGPAYYKRYPTAFERFTPDCRTNELGDCNQTEIVNAYDNTIFYTDYFLSEVINFLKDNSGNHETAMFYIGDHGESLGENGFYLHGLPYAIAPEEQTHVPLLIWVGPNSDLDYDETRKRKDQYFSHDAFSVHLLKAFEIESDLITEFDNQPALFEVNEGNPGTENKTRG